MKVPVFLAAAVAAVLLTFGANAAERTKSLQFLSRPAASKPVIVQGNRVKAKPGYVLQKRSKNRVSAKPIGVGQGLNVNVYCVCSSRGDCADSLIDDVAHCDKDILSDVPCTGRCFWTHGASSGVIAK